MTVQEFSDQFDVLWNNVSSNQAPGLNEYEKSVFLTKAQSQLVKEYFNNRLDSVGGGFDGSQKRQYDFSGLIRTEKLLDITIFGNETILSNTIDRRSKIFVFPENYFLSVNEILSDDRWQYSILPIDYAEYQRLMLKPYNFPVKRAAWRLITNRLSYTCNLTLESQQSDTMPSYDSYPHIENNAIYYEYNSKNFKLECSNAGWNDGEYAISLSLSYEGEGDVQTDNDVLKAIRAAFRELSKIVDIHNVDNNLTKACKFTSGLAGITAETDAVNYVDASYTFLASITRLPVVEIIGKFKGNIRYLLRYVKNLKPIILEDLTNYGDLTIEGIIETTECELPEECHEEILERAVTLAKIAWQGGTSTQAAAASRSRRDED